MLAVVSSVIGEHSGLTALKTDWSAECPISGVCSPHRQNTTALLAALEADGSTECEIRAGVVLVMAIAVVASPRDLAVWGRSEDPALRVAPIASSHLFDQWRIADLQLGTQQAIDDTRGQCDTSVDPTRSSKAAEDWLSDAQALVDTALDGS